MLFGLALLSVACQPEISVVEPLPSASPTQLTPTSSLTPTSTPEPSFTPHPTITRAPTRTQTLTPTNTSTPAPLILPGMPGFQPSPTYDPSLFPSATPASPPPCPVVNPDVPLPDSIKDKLLNYNDITDETLEFLNQGGSLDVLLQTIISMYPNEAGSSDLFDRLDFNNDGQAELLLEIRHLTVLGCSPDGNATYEIYGKFIDEGDIVIPPRIETIQDLNHNGFPEMLLTSRAFGFLSTAILLRIVEWDGKGINSVVEVIPSYPYRSIAEIGFFGEGIVYEKGSLELEDLDGNGTTEIIVNSGITGHPDTFAHGPWRAGKDILTWNGVAYTLLSSKIDPPQYRFQAVHDADQAALLGEYDEALRLYQEAISSDQLMGWSLELYHQQIELSYLGIESTPTPYPASPEEYGHLAAYAHFRILLLHALRGNLLEAQAVYDTLQSKFQEGQPGYASAVLAQYFWRDFQETQDFGQACNQALASLGEQSVEIITWLSGFHGWQSPSYAPVDLCPFGQTGTR
jgi:hypothetical protein